MNAEREAPEPPETIGRLINDELPPPTVGVIQHEPARKGVTAMFILLCVTVLATVALAGYALWTSESDLADREVELACVRAPSVEFDEAMALSMEALLDIVVGLSAGDQAAVDAAVADAADAKVKLNASIDSRRESMTIC